jgi:hypothetical protein
VVDVNPAKQGRFIPGTGHPIIAPTALADFGVTHVLAMNPNYHAEIAADLARIAPTTSLLDWSIL